MPLLAHAHPGIGIVKDSKGNIYYTDLNQVWKISNGKKRVVVPNVHTHELYIDGRDKLYGEGGYYDSKTEKFYHYLWVLHPEGAVDTVFGMKEAYVEHDFSFAKDINGNEFYTKQFLKTGDTKHIYRKTLKGKETVFAKGNFSGVVWLHPQKDGGLLYVQNNNLFRVDASGNINLVKEGIGNKKPSFKFSKNNITIWGAWEDNSDNLYVAVFSDQAVKKINPKGNMTTVYQSKGNWTPLHGVFDNYDRLWVLEGSDKNEVRVTMAPPEYINQSKTYNSLSSTILVGSILLMCTLFVLRHKIFS